MFLCVASFGATHFLLFEKERKEMKLTRIGTCIIIGALATSILAFSGCSYSQSSKSESSKDKDYDLSSSYSSYDNSSSYYSSSSRYSNNYDKSDSYYYNNDKDKDGYLTDDEWGNAWSSYLNDKYKEYGY